VIYFGDYFFEFVYHSEVV